MDSDIPKAEYEIDERGVGTCFICKVDLTSLQLTREHLQGKPHKKKKDIWELQRQALGQGKCGVRASMLAKCLSNLEVGKEEKTRSTPSVITNLAPTPAASALASEPCTVNELGVGKCNLCDVVFTSLQHMHEHCLGRKHQKQLKLWQCKRQMGATGGQIPHIQPGDDAAKNIPLPGPSSLALSGIIKSLSSTNTDNYRCPLCSAIMNSTNELELHISERHHRGISPPDTIQPIGVLIPQVTAGLVDPNPWKCGVCDKKLNTKSQLDIHLRTTKSHKSLSEDETQRLLEAGAPKLPTAQAMGGSASGTAHTVEDWDGGKKKREGDHCEAHRFDFDLPCVPSTDLEVSTASPQVSKVHGKGSEDVIKKNDSALRLL